MGIKLSGWMSRRWLCGAALLLVSGMPAQALAETPETCERFVGTAPLPESLSGIDRSEEWPDVMQCRNPWEPEMPPAIFQISHVTREAFGVCHFSMRETYKLADGRGWTVESSSPYVKNSIDYMARGGGQCPIAQDDSYVRVESITPDIFIRIMDFWDQLRSEPQRFKEALDAGCVIQHSVCRLMKLIPNVPVVKEMEMFKGSDGIPAYDVTTTDARGALWSFSLIAGKNGWEVTGIGESSD